MLIQQQRCCWAVVVALVYPGNVHAEQSPSACYNMYQAIPCGSSEFPRQAGDYPQTANVDRYQLLQQEQVVFDKRHQRYWMRCSYGASYTDSHCVGAQMQSWEQAQAACQQLQLGPYHWRLPSLVELNAILQVQQAGTKIETYVFPDTLAMPYWAADHSVTAPPQMQVSSAAWHVNFANGAIFDAPIQTPLYVRCVSDSAE